ncbi:MAG TPA: rhodanese-like domain-containing protein [Longimicrobiales bacterium]|nr:rhodanese-like domain-containing protein [Longimicrobiales bacterium]
MKVSPRILAFVAVGLGVSALIVGSKRGPTVDFDELARTVEREEDHVDAVELGRWLMEKKHGLRIVDIRSAEDYAAFHLPKAENIQLGSINRLEVKPGQTVVLYSDGGTHAAQAWFILRARGFRNVYFLRGGLTEWMDEVMAPIAPVDARTREVMEYFGGLPQPAGTVRSFESVKDRVKALKKRTC